MPRAHSYRESLPVFRFDVLELRFDYAFDPTIFAMEMLQPAGQCHPWFLSPAVAIYARNLLRHGFLDKLLERVPCRAAVAFALRKRGSGISSVVFTNDCLPYLWAPSRQHWWHSSLSPLPSLGASVWKYAETVRAGFFLPFVSFCKKRERFRQISCV